MKIGILHPGGMGAAIAASACNSGMDVYWCSEGRSAATLERANSLGLNALPSLQSLCDTCDLLISVCPPHAALELAELVMACNFRGIYADVNAVSPTTVTTIASKLEKAGIEVVDGGIIGLPPVTRGTTWLYLSGKAAAKVMDCFDAGPLETEVLSDRIGEASGLKICFAANSKGTAALHTAILAAADNIGVRDALENQWDIFNPGFTAKSHERIRQVARKSWRFTGEMKEIAATLESNGLPREFFDAAAEIYERQITFKDVEKEPAIEAILEMVRASRNTS